ncbi:MAG: hypothetical protein ABT940_06440 [Alphaproteobacteria bacterium]
MEVGDVSSGVVGLGTMGRIRMAVAAIRADAAAEQALAELVLEAVGGAVTPSVSPDGRGGLLDVSV